MRENSLEMEKGLTIRGVRTSRSVPIFTPEYYLISHPSWSPPCAKSFPFFQIMNCIENVSPSQSCCAFDTKYYNSPPEFPTLLLSKHLALAKILIHGQRTMICHSGGNSFEKAVKSIPNKKLLWQHCWNQCTGFQGDFLKGQH